MTTFDLLFENLGETCCRGTIGDVMVKGGGHREVLAGLDTVFNNTGP